MDNRYLECPAKMEDARFLTDYRSANTREQYVRSINGFVDTNQYRLFLQNNASQIISNNFDNLVAKNSCGTESCIFNQPTRVTAGTNSELVKYYDDVQLGRASRPKCPDYPKYTMMDA